MDKWFQPTLYWACDYLSILVLKFTHVNSLGPNDAIWRQGSGSTLAQVMAYCLTAPSHYLNQCWLIIRKVQWYSSEDNFTSNISAINHWNKLENYLYKSPLKTPRGQWVNKGGPLMMSFKIANEFLRNLWSPPVLIFIDQISKSMIKIWSSPWPEVSWLLPPVLMMKSSFCLFEVNLGSLKMYKESSNHNDWKYVKLCGYMLMKLLFPFVS